jgi:hypothetical protein
MRPSCSDGLQKEASARTRPAAGLLLVIVWSLACGGAPTSPSEANSGPRCDYRITPRLGDYAVPVEGATLVIDVNVTEGCTWRMSETALWIDVSGSDSRTSASRVIAVAANGGPSRSHSVKLSGLATVGSVERVELPVVTVNQEAIDIPIPSSPTFLWFASHGEFVGLGLTRLYRQTDAEFGANVTARRILIGVRGRDGKLWSLSLGAPTGQSLGVGRYDNVGRPETATRALLDFSGDGRGCNNTFGRFEILDIAFTASSVSRMHATFEQHCEGPTASPLLGEVWYVAPN